MNTDVIVIGAGAAGMMCAAVAGARGRRVLLIDHATELAEKIRISGGGRCNFTNIHCGPGHFLSSNPSFCRSALARYTPAHFIELVNRHGIAWHEKTLGQLFCDDSSQNIIDMLVSECDDAGVEWARPCQVQAIRHIDEAGYRFELDTSMGRHRCQSLIVATGGLSIPQIGATPFGYKIAEQFGLNIIPPRPALVPLTLDATLLARLGELSGASFEAIASLGRRAFAERVLLTHRGLSGPAILQISSYWQDQDDKREPIALDLLPNLSAADWLLAASTQKMLLSNVLAEHLPQRFARAFAAQFDDSRPFNQWSKKDQQSVADTLKCWRIAPSGTLGYRKAEVTLGGVDTRELSSRTMESERVPGLFFIGEVIDVTGHLGGFNFQWAWSSGYAAGISA